MSGQEFSLPQHLSDFIDKQVAVGRHRDASEVVREALRRYADDVEAERSSLAAIEEIARAGIAAIERGDYLLVRGSEGTRDLLEGLNRQAKNPLTALHPCP